jgi:hypothetical protein
MRKITLLLLFVVAAVFSDVQAQTDFYTVLPNNGGTSVNGRAPQGARTCSRSVWLITADEMLAAGFTAGSVVNSLGFNYGTPQDVATTGSMVIYLQNTADVANNKSTAWATAIAGMTTVSNGNITIPATPGTFDIPFAGGSAFTYTGDAIYVAFDYQNFAGTLSGTTNIALCNTDLVGGLKGVLAPAGATTPPATLSVSNFRPETRLGKAVTCSMPNSVSVGNATETSIDISFIAPGGAVSIEYGPYGFAPGTGTVINNITSPYTLAGLDASTVYDFYLIKDCGAGDMSEVAGSFATHTVFTSADPTYNTSFETLDFPYMGWTAVPNNTANSWFINESAALAQDGNFEAVAISPAAAAADEWLLSRGVNLVAGSLVTVDYFVANFVNGSANTASYALTVGSSQDPTSQTTILGTETGIADAAYTPKSFDFTPPTTGTYYFGFHHTSGANAAGTHALLLDNFTVTQTLGTSEFLNSHFSVFPNPAKDVINISNDTNAVVSTVEMTDLNGRTIKKQNVNNVAGQISVSDLATGVYMMKISTDQGSLTKKIVKE